MRFLIEADVISKAKLPLRRADLREANLSSANLSSANLIGAKNLTQDQLTTAKLCCTTLLEGITLAPNRDCEELSIDPETGFPLVP
jgi:uncharacterized protein YjbI with pentapeptide repeats